MLDKIKDVGAQVGNAATDAVQAVTSTVKDGVASLADSASSMGSAINEKAVRASTAQMCRILEVALEEVQQRPLAARPLQLTASVNIGVVSLEMQVEVERHAALGDGPVASE